MLSMACGDQSHACAAYRMGVDPHWPLGVSVVPSPVVVLALRRLAVAVVVAAGQPIGAAGDVDAVLHALLRRLGVAPHPVTGLPYAQLPFTPARLVGVYAPRRWLPGVGDDPLTGRPDVLARAYGAARLALALQTRVLPPADVLGSFCPRTDPWNAYGFGAGPRLGVGRARYLALLLAVPYPNDQLRQVCADGDRLHTAAARLGVPAELVWARAFVDGLVLGLPATMPVGTDASAGEQRAASDVACLGTDGQSPSGPQTPWST